jgi:hypothetical protein
LLSYTAMVPGYGEKGNRLFMTQDERLQRRARHETAHAGWAVHSGFWVDRVMISPEGATDVTFPFPPWALCRQYKRKPIQTIDTLTRIVGVFIAPEVVHYIPTVGADLEALVVWRRYWNGARLLTNPSGPTWEGVLQQAGNAVWDWASAGNRRKQLAAMARHLLVQGHMTGQEWQRLMYFHSPSAASNDATVLGTNCTWRNVSWHCLQNSWHDYAGMPGLVWS